MDNSVGKKHDHDKLRYDLLPPEALESIVAVLTFGAKKYAPENWRLVENWSGRYFAAAQRHIWAYKKGESVDPETGIHHLAHAATNLVFLLELEQAKSPS